MATFCWMKSWGTWAQNAALDGPGGWTLYLFCRSRMNCTAEVVSGELNLTHLPLTVSKYFAFCSMKKPWITQGDVSTTGASTPHRVTLPLASRTVSFWASATSSCQVLGGAFGSSPASRNRSLL